jgi:hypothetical protein
MCSARVWNSEICSRGHPLRDVLLSAPRHPLETDLVRASVVGEPGTSRNAGARICGAPQGRYCAESEVRGFGHVGLRMLELAVIRSYEGPHRRTAAHTELRSPMRTDSRSYVLTAGRSHG